MEEYMYETQDDGLTFRERQDREFVSEDPCAQTQIYTDIQTVPRDRIFYEEMFKIDVCNYINIIEELFTITTGDKNVLITPQSMQHIPDIQYKNVKGYVLGYLACKNVQKDILKYRRENNPTILLDRNVISVIQNNMEGLRITDLTMIIRYVRFWNTFYPIVL